MIYFSWAADSQAETFYGPSNPRTGRRSQVGVLSAFTSRKARATFIEQSQGIAVVITRPYARQMKAGLDDRAFNKLVAVLVGEEQ
ncbi:hypothetical protein [Aeromonas veronii]|uniref:Uncharacterized protein n=1 Tax=Aeromonas veronii TaxID=654 RepID=A0AAX2UWF7_AERVE|nr:hypothetical protein [Aeromonas veronii]TND55549.1 hypothetical protein CF123_06545 [Aeromonas veronii]